MKQLMKINYLYKYPQQCIQFSNCTSYVMHYYVYIIPSKLLPCLEGLATFRLMTFTGLLGGWTSRCSTTSAYSSSEEEPEPEDEVSEWCGGKGHCFLYAIAGMKHVDMGLVMGNDIRNTLYSLWPGYAAG